MSEEAEISAWEYFINEDMTRGDGFLGELSDLDLCILACDSDFMLRPEQKLPDTPVVGAVCGRGWGKSESLCRHINDGVEAGHYASLGLLGQDEQRTLAVQVTPLIERSPPWFKAEHVGNQVVWPNGATAEILTPEAPGKIRGYNLDLAWCSELVAWKPATAIKAWDNVTTATRLGRARILFDTTSEGRNELIDRVFTMHESSPEHYPIIRGTMFQNPIFSKAYIQRTVLQYSGRRYEEEINGAVFRETDGAIFAQTDIDSARVDEVPHLPLIVVGSDPAITTNDRSDLTGFIVGGITRSGDVYITHDLSDKLTPEEHGAMMYREYERGAAGAVVETNRGGQYITSGIRAVFREYDIRVVVLDKNRPMPTRSVNTFWIREVHARGTKNSAERAGGPSTLYSQGKVHHYDHLEDLEKELCTFEPGTTESPNRYDAAMHLITELSGINTDRATPAQRQRSTEGTKQTNKQLRDQLRRIGSSRSVV